MDLKREKSLLQKVEHKAKQTINGMTGDRLICKHCKNTMQFYINTNGENKYLSKKDDRTKISKLAQERYALELMRVVESLKNSLKRFEDDYDYDLLKAVYEQMPDEVRAYVVSYTPDYRVYGDEWANREYRRMSQPEDKKFKTDNGEYVRSKSELIIANKLKSMGIKYRYECAKVLRGYGIVYPDFTILDPNSGEEVILEHFGRMDDEEYLNRSFISKLETYAQNGIVPGKGLICTYETIDSPLNTEYLECVLNAYFKKDQTTIQLF